MNIPSRVRLWCCAGLCVIALAVLWNANGCPYLRDSGELTTSTATAGIAHPTGFPALHSVSGVLRALPIGPISFRMVLLSALAALAAVAALGLAASRLRPQMWQGASGVLKVATWVVMALSFLLTDTVWHHTVNLEVYLPLTACTGFAAWLGLQVLERGELQREWRLLALLTGICVGIHGEAMLLAGLMLVYVFAATALRRKKPFFGLVWNAFFPGFLFFLAGALSVAYMPLRSLAGTQLDWGNTSTLSGFLDHMTAATIRSSFAQQMMPGFAGLSANFVRYAGQLWEQSAPMLLLGLVGIVVLARHALPKAGMLLMLWVGDAFFSVVMNPMAQLEHQTSTVSFWVMHLLTLSLLWGGAEQLLQSQVAPEAVTPSVRAPAVALAVGLLCAGWNVTAPENRSWRSGSAGYEMGLDAWQQAEPGGILLSASDEISGQSLYLTLVEQRRPDVVHAVRQMICDPAFLTLATKRGVSDSQATQYLAHQAVPICDQVGKMGPPNELWASYLQVLRTDKVPVLWEVSGASGPDEQLAALFSTPGFPMLPLDWNKSPDQGFAVEQWLAPMSQWLHTRLAAGAPDRLTGWVLGEFMAQQAAKARPTTAAQQQLLVGFLQTAVQVGPTSCKARNNLLAQWLQPDSLSQAVPFGKESVALCPDHLLVHVNYLRSLLLSGAYPDARQELRSMKTLFPEEAIAPRLENMRRQMQGMQLLEAVRVLDEG